MSLDKQVKEWWQHTKQEISHHKKKTAKQLKTAMAIAGLTILSTTYAQAQKAEATINVADQAGRPASGMVEVTSADTAYEQSLSDGTAYFLLKDITGIDLLRKQGYNLGPNPVVDQLNIKIPNNKEEGIFEAYDATGKQLARASTQDGSFNIPSTKGIIILQYTAKDGSKTADKLIANGPINATITQADNWSANSGTRKSSSNDNDDEYTFTYTGSDDLETKDTTLTIPTGNHESITLSPQYTLKDLALNFNNIGRNVNITTLGQQTTTNEQGNANITYQERISKQEQKQTIITYNGKNVVTETYNTTLNIGENNNFPHAQLTFNITYDSNRPGTTYQTKDDQEKDITGGTTARADSIHTTTIAQDPTCQNCTTDTIKQWIKDGENTITANIQEQQQTYQFWLHDDQSSPQGANIKGWKNGAAILQATINNAAYETNHLESTQENITLDSLVTTMTGYDKDLKINYTLTPGGQKQTINLQEQQQTYTYNFKGKAFNGPATQRIKNVQNALTATNEKGQEFPINLDNNGEFNTNITVNHPEEKITISPNTKTLPQYSQTFSITKSNEEYPINKGLGEDYSTCDWTNQADTAVRIQAQLLDDDYNNISIIEKTYTQDDTIQWALKDGTVKYEPTTPLRPYVRTIDRGTGEPITATQQQIYEEQMTKAIGFLNLPETGPVVPTAPIASGAELPPREGNWMIYQWEGDGYWNGIYQGSIVGYVVGSEAHTDANAYPNMVLDEIMGRYIRPGPGQSEQGYGYVRDSTGNFIDTSDKGKVEINMMENWEILSGKK